MVEVIRWFRANLEQGDAETVTSVFLVWQTMLLAQYGNLKKVLQKVSRYSYTFNRYDFDIVIDIRHVEGIPVFLQIDSSHTCSCLALIPGKRKYIF